MTLRLADRRHSAFRNRRIGAAFAVLAALSAGPINAGAELCEQAALIASHETGVPLEVLRAIMLAETGRKLDGQLRPWPWAVHEAGQGHWMTSRIAAEAHVAASLDAGAQNIDIGCFQLNHRWHGSGFRTLSEMFDPVGNAKYAARFLADLHAESGDWTIAAGTYHSRTESHASRYRARIAALMEQPGKTTMAERAQPPKQKPGNADNPYRLPQRGAPQSAGSLVPVMPSGHGLIRPNSQPLIGS